MRELKELRPHPCRQVGTPSPDEAGEGKDHFSSFLAFSTFPKVGIHINQRYGFPLSRE